MKIHCIVLAGLVLLTLLSCRSRVDPVSMLFGNRLLESSLDCSGPPMADYWEPVPTYLYGQETYRGFQAYILLFKDANRYDIYRDNIIRDALVTNMTGYDFYSFDTSYTVFLCIWS